MQTNDILRADTPPALPEMFLFWDWQIRFEVELRHTSNLTDSMKHAQVSRCLDCAHTTLHMNAI